MTIITDIYTCINSHNAQALENIFPDKQLANKINWQTNQYIKILNNVLIRCVEVHARDCLPIILGLKDFDKIDSKKNIYGDALDIAIGNYLANPTDNNFYFVDQIITKKPDKVHQLIYRIIWTDSIDILLRHIHLIDKSSVHGVYFIGNLTEFAISAVANSNYKIFEFVYKQLYQELNSLPNINTNPNIRKIVKKLPVLLMLFYFSIK